MTRAEKSAQRRRTEERAVTSNPLADVFPAETLRHSILFRDLQAYSELALAIAPPFFKDLHLDQFVAAIVSGREAHGLEPYFYCPLRSPAEIRYRQAVMAEAEILTVSLTIRYFTDHMQAVRRQFDRAQEVRHKYGKFRWFLEAAALYCETMSCFAELLLETPLESDGLRDMRVFVVSLVNGPDFQSLAAQIQDLRSRLEAIRYVIDISGRRIAIRAEDAGLDYAAQLRADFRAFNQSPQGSSPFDTREDLYLNQVEEAIVNMLVELYREPFQAIERFYDNQHASLIHPNVALLEREIHFCLAWNEHMSRLRSSGLSFCYPTIANDLDEAFGKEVFDVSLADVLIRRNQKIVTNSFHLVGTERMVVVSGPNQGGKTTFARAFGQMHHLARIGCPVPGQEACITLRDEIFTIFEREEDIRTQTGKLEEELLRIHSVLQSATAKSLLIMNESLASTSLADALLLGRKIMAQIDRIGLLCIFVTFIEELASFNLSTVSMVAAVDADDPSKRTFQLVRRRADGHAYAMAIAERYRLRRDTICERISAHASDQLQ